MEEKFSYQTEKFIMVWDSENKILFISMTGDQSIEDAEDFSARYNEFLAKIDPGETVKMLIDAKGLKKAPPDARKIYAKMIKDPDTRKKGVVAICSPNPAVRMMGNFAGAIADKKEIKIKMFGNVLEGKEWLKKYKD